jgi:hypothetical protein
VVSTYVCRVCKVFSITVMTRLATRGGKTIKDRMCRGCWDDMLDIANAIEAMNGEGA